MNHTDTKKQAIKEFVGNPQTTLNQVLHEHCDLILEDNGEDKIVLISDERYQNILKSLQELESYHAIHNGIKDMEAGRVIPKEEFFTDLHTKYDL